MSQTRYWLERDLAGSHDAPLYDVTPRGVLGFVMLNPSTADVHLDDPTVRRCIGFAKREKAARLVVANLFAHRSTDPGGLCGQPLEPSPDELAAWLRMLHEADTIVAAWGHGGAKWLQDLVQARAVKFSQMAINLKAELRVLGFTANKFPRHPLYVRRDAPLIPFALYTGS